MYYFNLHRKYLCNLIANGISYILVLKLQNHRFKGCRDGPDHLWLGWILLFPSPSKYFMVHGSIWVTLMFECLINDWYIFDILTITLFKKRLYKHLILIWFDICDMKRNYQYAEKQKLLEKIKWSKNLI